MDERWQGFKKPNFGSPPANYIAGLGRGATGFITRSDIGPAKMAENPFMKAAAPNQDAAEFLDSKYDEWLGYSTPLFAPGKLDQQDKQAEEAYNFVDKRMDERRKEQREKLIKEELKKLSAQRKSISDQFSDLKRQLSKVSYDDWLNLPQSADSSIKRQKKDKYVPVPDSMIAAMINDSKPMASEAAVPGESINDLGQAREILLKSKLDKASNDVAGRQTVVDKTGYLTSLGSFKINQQSYLGDLKKARLLLKSAISANPNNPETWISAARVEELDGKLMQARLIMQSAIEHCSHHEDVWIEAARLEKAGKDKALLVKALGVLPKSDKLWLTASSKEVDPEMKRKVLRKGLEHNPQSVRLWKALIESEDQSQAKNLLYKAVECLPKEIQLWIALAKLETYENAKAVLNKARKNNPLDLQIWIGAAKLEQTQSGVRSVIFGKIEAIVSKAQQVLQKNGHTLKRDDWLEEAVVCEKSGNIITCETIVKLSLSLGVEQAELENVLTKDCTHLAEQGLLFTPRYLYYYGIDKLGSRSLIEKALEFEKNVRASTKSDDSFFNEVLRLAIQKCKEEQGFWMMMVDKFIQEKDFESARKLLQQAQASISNKEVVLLKKVQICSLLGQEAQAEALLEEGMKLYNKVSWIQAAKYYIRKNNYNRAWEICQELYKKAKDEEVFTLAFKIQNRIGTYENSRAILQKAVQKYDHSTKLWLTFSDFQIKHGYSAKARTLLQKARVKLPKNPDLHQASIRLELNSNNPRGATFMLSKALVDCPKSGKLWAIAIELEPGMRKAKEAMEACPQDPQVNLCVAKLFWKERKLQKAKNWFEKALGHGPTNGDCWAYLYRFVVQNEPQTAPAVLAKLRSVKMTDGRLWKEANDCTQGDIDESNESNLKRVIKLIDAKLHSTK